MQLFRERLSKKSGYLRGTLHTGQEEINIQVCIYAREEIVLPLRRPISVASLFNNCRKKENCLFVRKNPLKFKAAKRTLFPHVQKERIRASLR